MTKEEIIDNLELYTVGRPKKDRVSITVEELQSLIDEIKALEQQSTTQEILSHIETGITATGQSDSYCVGFCNALVWLKSCITHEEPQFFEDNKVSENSTGSTTTDDVMAIHTQGLDEGIRCAMCTNSMKSEKGCDGGCVVDEDMYKKVMDTISNHIFKQPTSDDCVSRQAVLDKIVLIELPDGQSFYDIDPEDVKNIPPVTPTQSWIPLVWDEYPTVDLDGNDDYIYAVDYSVPMPKEDEWVLITDENHNVVKVQYDGYDFGDYVRENILAWQPLPKPYEEK